MASYWREHVRGRQEVEVEVADVFLPPLLPWNEWILPQDGAGH